MQISTFNNLWWVSWIPPNLCITMYVFAMYNLQAARNGIPIFPWMLLIRTIWPVLLEIMLGRMAAKREIQERAHKKKSWVYLVKRSESWSVNSTNSMKVVSIFKAKVSQNPTAGNCLLDFTWILHAELAALTHLIVHVL